MESVSINEPKDRSRESIAEAVRTLYESVKQRKMNEYLKEIQNAKQKNGKRKNI